MELIDVHAHLFDANLPVSPTEAVATAQKAGVVQFVVPGLDVATSRQAIALSRQFPGVCFATIGVCPHEVLVDGFDLTASIDELRSLLARHPEPVEGSSCANKPDLSTPRSLDSDLGAQDDKRGGVVGIGEIGIDYYHHDRDETGEAQREAFAAQLELAIDQDLPVIVHGRGAYEDVLDVIRAHPGSRGLLHSFEASYEIAKQALDLGWIISFTALVTYPDGEVLRDVVKRLPLDRITIETDTPYLPPQSIRSQKSEVRSQNTNTPSPLTPHDSPVIGKRGINNQPAYMVETAQVLADLQGVSLEKFADVTTAMARSIFQIPTL